MWYLLLWTVIISYCVICSSQLVEHLGKMSWDSFQHLSLADWSIIIPTFMLKCFSGYYLKLKGWSDKMKLSGSHCHSGFLLKARCCSYTLKLCWLQGLLMIWLISLRILSLTGHTVSVRFTSQFILELCSDFCSFFQRKPNNSNRECSEENMKRTYLSFCCGSCFCCSCEFAETSRLQMKCRS